MMRKLLISMTIFLSHPAFSGSSIIETGDPLHSFLTEKNTLAQKTAITPKTFCGDTNCTIRIEKIGIDDDTGVIRYDNKTNIKVETHAIAPPEVDWRPFGTYRVKRHGQNWGICLEFSHEGLGKSGRFQRWSSLVLLPWKGERPVARAHRFVGYWISCNDLYEGDRLGEVVLPVIEHVDNDEAPLRFVRWHCSAKGCREEVDPRPVHFVPDSESGAISVGE